MAVFGGLYLTERGRRTRDQIEPLLDEIIREIRRPAAALPRNSVRRHRRADALWMILLEKPEHARPGGLVVSGRRQGNTVSQPATAKAETFWLQPRTACQRTSARVDPEKAGWRRGAAG